MYCCLQADVEIGKFDLIPSYKRKISANMSSVPSSGMLPSARTFNQLPTMLSFVIRAMFNFRYTIACTRNAENRMHRIHKKWRVGASGALYHCSGHTHTAYRQVNITWIILWPYSWSISKLCIIFCCVVSGLRMDPSVS